MRARRTSTLATKTLPEFLPDVVRRWQAGWVVSRGFAAPTESDGVLRVHIGQTERSDELIVLDADGDPWSIDRAAQAGLSLRDPWVTVPTSELGRVADRLAEHGYRTPPLPEWLMRIPRFADQVTNAPADGYRIEVEERSAGAVFADVTSPDGDAAGSGQLGLADRVGVPDRITIESAHRRRGLGGAMMTALAEAAVERGADEGLLVASAQGRALYETLGWQLVGAVVIGRLPF